MKLFVHIVLLSVVMSYGGIACSEDGVIVRTKAEPSSPWVGQKVTLTIDVLAHDGWATIKNFPLLEVQGAYLHRYETQGTRLNENVGSTSYSGQRYEVLLFAQKAGELTIDPFPVEVSVKTWGTTDAATNPVKLSTESVLLTVLSPEGLASGDYLPATARLDAKQAWSSQEKEYQAGDAIERTVTRKANDVSAMVFTPFELTEVDGMSCYPDQPEVNDSFNRGVLAGTRVDNISCILERPGELRFPDLTVSYLDITEKKIDTVVLPGITFTVKGSSQDQGAGIGTSRIKEKDQIWLYLLVSTFLLCIVLYLSRNRLLAVIQMRRATRHNSEQYLFKQIENTVRNGDKNVMLTAIMRWLDRLPGMKQPTRLDEFAKRVGDEEMVLMLKDLNRRANWTEKQCQTLYEFLKQGRRTYIAINRGKTPRIKELPPVGLVPHSTKAAIKNR